MPGPAADFRKPSLSPALIALGLSVMHLLVLWSAFSAATYSPDANGYFVQARLIATEGTTQLSVESPLQYVGMHWLEMPDGSFRSRYPAGLPLLAGIFYRIGGPALALFLNPLLASATIWLTFVLGRRVGGDWCGLIAAAAVAVNATANRHALAFDAHTSAAFFLVAGIVALLAYSDSESENRAPWRGLLAGVLLGLVPTIRYPEAVCGLAIAGWLLWRVRPTRDLWPPVVGALVPVIALAVHNRGAYGAFWKTGYYYTHEQTGFSWQNLVEHAGSYLVGLSGDGMFLLWAFAVFGLVAMCAARRTRPTGALFVGLIVPLMLVYMAYYWGGSGPGGASMGLRFLVPAFPFLSVAAAWALVGLAGSGVPGARAGVVAIILLQVLAGARGSFDTVSSTKRTLAAARGVRAVLEAEVPTGALIGVGDRQLAESLDFTGQWRLLDAAFVSGRRGPGGFGGPRGFGGGPGGFSGGVVPRGPMGEMFGPDGPEPDRPSPRQAGRMEALRAEFMVPDRGERLAHVWREIQDWMARAGKEKGDGPVPLYWLTASPDELESVLPFDAEAEVVTTVEAPERGAMFGGASRIARMRRGPGPGGFFPMDTDTNLSLVRINFMFGAN